MHIEAGKRKVSIMIKYNSDLDLSLDSSTGIILDKIHAGSTVLEFGCAFGRMTRYMKNMLDCQVYIVEYDQEEFDIAMQYAADGVCDDILTLSWMEKFKGIEFDSIIFADVLEHLTQPEVALSNASKMLKEQGHIYISIPNVAHNDVLLKAFDNHFDYTKVGILDDTHLHFWGYENLFSLASSNGLYIHNIEVTYCPTGQTEQYSGETIQCSPILLNYFNERKYAEAYQFIVILGKEPAEDKGNRGAKVKFHPNSITSHVYVDDGAGFNEQDVLAFQSENTGSGRYAAHYVLGDLLNIKRIRFDPVELQGCILQNLSVRQNGKELGYVYPEHLRLEKGILFAGTDPMVYVDITSDVGAVTIDADIVVPGDEYLNVVQGACFDKQSEIESLKQEIDLEKSKHHEEISNLNIQNQSLCGEINTLNAQNESLRGEINNLNVQSEELRRQIGMLNAQNEGLRGEISNLSVQNESSYREINSLSVQNGSLCTDLGAYIALANKKDELLIGMENQLKEKDGYIVNLEGQVSEKDKYITNLEEQINHYRNRKCIKICNLRWRIFNAIKRRLKRLIRK